MHDSSTTFVWCLFRLKSYFIPCRAFLPHPVAVQVRWNCVTSWPLGGRQILLMWSSNFNCLPRIRTAMSLNKEPGSKFGCRAMATTWTTWTGFGWSLERSLHLPTSTTMSLDSKLWNRTLQNHFYFIRCNVTKLVSEPCSINWGSY